MWPEYFPDHCPPDDAKQDRLEVYRLVKNDPPQEEDFQPTIIEYPHRPFSDDKVCIACGVSVFKKIEDIEKIRRRYQALRERKIAKGVINEDDGLILKAIKGSHVTWWLQSDTPQNNFTEIVSHATI